MKKQFILLIFITFVISSCKQEVRQLTDGAWFTQVYGSGVNEGDSIYVEAGITFFTFEQKSILESSGTVKLIGKGNVIYLFNNYEFGLVSKDGKTMPAVIETLSDFNAVGTWTLENDKVVIEWNTDSTAVNGNFGNCINLNEASATMFMSKHKDIIDKRSSECHPEVLKIVNNWLEQRSTLKYNTSEDKWNTTIDGQENPVMWKMKTKE